MSLSASDLAPWLEPRPDSGYRPALTVGTKNFGVRTSAAEAERIVHRALDAGLRFFDTADFTGDGAAERILGQALRGRREQVGLCLGLEHSRLPLAWRHVPGAALTRATDEALERLATDYVDLLLVDFPPGPEHGLEALYSVGRLMEQGKVRHWGLSGRSAGWRDVFAQCDTSGLARPRVLRTPHNALREGVTHVPGVPRLHVAVHGILAGGLLAGRYLPGPVPPGSRFDWSPDDRRRYFFRCARGFAEEFAALARELGMSPVTLAHAWLVEDNAADSIVLGPATQAHLEESVKLLWTDPVPDSDALDEVLDRVEALHRDWFGDPV